MTSTSAGTDVSGEPSRGVPAWRKTEVPDPDGVCVETRTLVQSYDCTRVEVYPVEAYLSGVSQIVSRAETVREEMCACPSPDSLKSLMARGPSEGKL